MNAVEALEEDWNSWAGKSSAKFLEFLVACGGYVWVREQLIALFGCVPADRSCPFVPFVVKTVLVGGLRANNFPISAKSEHQCWLFLEVMRNASSLHLETWDPGSLGSPGRVQPIFLKGATGPASP